jgi:hypothetical protein
MDKKPQVMPTKEQMDIANAERAKREAFEIEKKEVTNQIYVEPARLEDTPDGHKSALEMMRERTAHQIAMKEQAGKVVMPELAETTDNVYKQVTTEKHEEQMKLRDEQLAMNKEQTQSYQRLAAEATNREYQKPTYMDNTQPTQPTYTQPTYTQPTYTQPMQPVDYGKAPTSVNQHVIELSQPDFNSPFDVIPLPSKGKTYKNKKANVRVSYMTTADETILLSPNLLESGEFLSILFNRKILENDLRYRDLLVGDRNAIMLWLRATGYGEMYPITIADENGEAFNTEIDLNTLKYKDMGAEPDAEGLFDYTFKLSQTQIKFRLMTCGDIEDVEAIVSEEKDNGVLVDNTATYLLERSIVEVNGSRDRRMIKDFIRSIRIMDGRAFNEYVESIESGVDLNITVGTPGGGSVNTFLPLNIGFFWPDIRL